MYLYVYEGYKGKKGESPSTDELVRKAAVAYIKEEEVPLEEGATGQILRTDKGRPFFKDVPIEFSVSHTGDLWVCLMDRVPVGVDIQVIRQSRQEKIMDRYYTSGEREYVEAVGDDGFFQIWTRKEAYAKYLGTGFTESLRDFCTITNTTVDFIDFDIRDGVKGSCCVRGAKELWIRKLV